MFAGSSPLLLQRAGYTVLTAQDAAQAVMQADRDAPDLILMDITMPAGDGFSLLDGLTAPLNTTPIPTIVLTGSDDPEVEVRALAAGVTRVPRKPCDNAVLLQLKAMTAREPVTFGNWHAGFAGEGRNA